MRNGRSQQHLKIKCEEYIILEIAANINMSILVISDLHLNSAEPQGLAALTALRQKWATNCSDLYILGDFFEAWVGDDDGSDFIRHVKKSLKNLNDQGVPIFIMRGNRDFLLGEKFCAEAGATFLPDPSIISVNNQKLF